MYNSKFSPIILLPTTYKNLTKSLYTKTLHWFFSHLRLIQNVKKPTHETDKCTTGNFHRLYFCQLPIKIKLNLCTPKHCIGFSLDLSLD